MSKWWIEKTDEHVAIFEAFATLDDNQSYRKANNLYHLRLYEGKAIKGLEGGAYTHESVNSSVSQINVVESVIDTAASQLAANKPRVQFLTINGDWALQRKAEMLSRFNDGQDFECGIYDKARSVIMDALVFGTGLLKFYEVDGKIKASVVFPNDVLVDDVEARNAQPRTMYQHVVVSKDTLKEQFPKFGGYIDDASLIRDNEGGGNIYEPVSVVEAWHLPPDGKHVIAVNTKVLFAEEWMQETFPIVAWRWKTRPLGFWGKGLAEILAPIQCRLNRLVKKIEIAEDLNVPLVLVPKGARINEKKWQNKPWILLEYAGDPPKPWIAPSISNEFYAEVERLESKAYQIAGVSRLAAQSQKPAGLSSGEALRQYRDYQTERFLVAFQSLEDFFVECARQKIELAKRINDKGKGNYSIMAVDRQGKQDVAQVIKWADVDISEDKYIMRPYPVGFLPSTPAGKVQKAAELVQAFPQLQDQALQLLGGIPDVDAAVSLATSDLDELDQIASQFLEGKEYIAPEPTMNLRLALRRMQQHLTRATVRGAPENVLQMFRDFITSTIDLLEASAPPQPQPQPIAGNEPGG